MKGFDFNHPFFDPLWVRVAVVGVCIGWGLFEFSTGALMWGGLFFGLGGWAGFSFFVVNPDRGGDRQDDQGES